MSTRVSILMLAACLAWGADDPVSVSKVVTAVRNGIRKKTKDPEVAATVGKFKLSESLEDRILEILESEGAGPQTLGALQQLRDASRLLPKPADPPSGMTPPPPPSLAEEGQTWEAARAIAVNYTDALPNFTCTRTVYRWAAPSGTETWTAAPTLVGDLTYFEKKERFTLRTVDGKPASQGSELEGVVSGGEFGVLLSKIFQPASQTEHRWDHWTILRKRPTAVYFFRIAAAHQPHILQVNIRGRENGESTIATGARGFLYLDVATHTITRIIEDAEGIPKDFPIRQSGVVLDYEYAEVGGKTYLLPLRAEVKVDAENSRNLSSIEFRAYRKYDSNSQIQFGSGKLP